MYFAFLLSALESFALSLALLLIHNAAAHWRDDLHSVQAVHVRAASRFGGLAVLLAFAAGWLTGPTQGNGQILQSLTCVLPILVAGFLEDSGFKIAPRWRLFAAVCASFLAIFACELIIDRVGFAKLDFILEHRFIAVSLTVLVLTGVSQSFNLIDGLHGLCSLTSMIIVAALMVIAAKGGQAEIVQALALMGAGLVGFLALNYPRGLLFLGDAGATSIGFILAGIAIEMMALQSSLSPWALILIFFWPIADTILTVLRRLSRQRSAFRPDRMHFHHVVMRGFEILMLGKKNRIIANPVSTLIMVPLIAAPSVAGVLLWNDDGLALIATLVFAALFVVTYRATVWATHHVRKHPVRSETPEILSLDLSRKVKE